MSNEIDKCRECENDCRDEWYDMDSGLGTPYILCAKCYKKRGGNWSTSTRGGGRFNFNLKESETMSLCSECRHAIKPPWWDFMNTPFNHPWRCRVNENPPRTDNVTGKVSYPESGGLFEGGSTQYRRCRDHNRGGDCAKWEGKS